MGISVLPIKQVREEFAAVLDQVGASNDVVITQRGKGRAVLVDLDRFNEMIERLEYLEDSIDALTAEEHGAVDLDELTEH